jgi:hypothetical protein
MQPDSEDQGLVLVTKVAFDTSESRRCSAECPYGIYHGAAPNDKVDDYGNG